MPPSNGRPWTAEEDSQLIQAIYIHGENDKWQTIAQSVLGRTNKACRKRWLHSLSPSVKKTPWTPEEDQVLLSLYAIHSSKWSVIARHIPGRTDDACSKRYREALDPSLRKDEWSPEEDARLLESYACIGGKWGQIGQELQRSGLACRNRWRMIERKRSAALRKGTGASEANAVDMNDSSEHNGDMEDWGDISIYQDPSFWSTDVAYQGPASSSQASAHLHTHSGTSDTSRVAAPLPTDLTSLSSAEVNQSLLYQPAHIHLDPDLLSSSLPTCALQQSPPQRSVAYDQWQAPHIVFAGTGSRYPSSNEREAIQHIEPTSTEVDLSFVDPVTDRDTANVDISPIVTSHPVTQPSSPHRPPTSDLRATAREDWSVPRAEGNSSSPPVSATGQGLLPPPQLSHEGSSGTPRAEIGPRGEVAPYYRPPCRKLATSSKSSVQSRAPPRLSATLSVSDDPAILPYTCGYPSCWSAEANSGFARYATSQELSDHNKAEHEGELVQENGKPFRCGLEGCGKGWKSLNGLQYHLQISKAHFRDALAATRRQQKAHTPPQPSVLPTDEVTEHTSLAGTSSIPAKPRKMFPCPHPDCPNEYKQLSGLRYHLSHGHSCDMPAQLDVVPPTLARRVAARAAEIISSARS